MLSPNSEEPDFGVPDPLGPAFVALSATADARGKLEALRRAATDLATPVRHGMLDYYEIEGRLILLAETHGLVDELTRGAVESVVVNSLKTPPFSDVAYHADEPPPYGEPVSSASKGSLAVASAAELAEVDVPPRRWLVPDRVPMAAHTLLSGDGAAGKTTILLQLCHAVVRDTDWLGSIINEPGPVIFLTAEEDRDEIHRRLAAINAHTGSSFADLAALHFISLPGEDAVLAATGKDGIVRPTALFQKLEEAAQHIRPKLIAIEAAADVFAGNENSRPEVRQFSQIIRRLAIQADAAVIVVQHPSVTGLSEGSGRSGSTGWRNSFRSQLHFAGMRAGKDEDETDGGDLPHSHSGKIELRTGWRACDRALAAWRIRP